MPEKMSRFGLNSNVFKELQKKNLTGTSMTGFGHKHMLKRHNEERFVLN